MKNLIGKITASLIEKDGSIPEDLIEKINNNIKPPAELCADDVHIRAMYIVSDRVNSYGGCFPADEHARLTELLIDSPVLIGHRKDSLPIARNFHAEEVTHEGANWVKVYFYWLRNAENGEDLRQNIDAGIYKEGSISFIFNFPECSVCGEDIRQCRHRPFEEYTNEGGETKQVYFNYRQVLKVLETSLVYRGSVHDTSITDQLYFDGAVLPEVTGTESIPILQPYLRLWDVGRLDAGKDYLIMPAYESLRLTLSKRAGKIRLYNGGDEEVKSELLRKYLSKIDFPGQDYAVECRLIGYCGKKRQPVEKIIRYLNGQKSTVRRLELKICDLVSSGNRDMTAENGDERRRLLERLFENREELLIPAQRAAGDTIRDCFVRAATRYGVEVIECGAAGRYLMTSHKRVPAVISGVDRTPTGYRYRLACFINGKKRAVSDTVFSESAWQEGDSLELETYAVGLSDNSIKLLQPKIIDGSRRFNPLDDITLLTEDSPVDSNPEKYSLIEYNENRVVLVLQDSGRQAAFELRHFDEQLLDGGHWFFADAIDFKDNGTDRPLGDGSIITQDNRSRSMCLTLSGILTGDYRLRPVIKNGVERFVFYRLPAADQIAVNESSKSNGGKK